MIFEELKAKSSSQAELFNLIAGHNVGNIHLKVSSNYTTAWSYMNPNRRALQSIMSVCYVQFDLVLGVPRSTSEWWRKGAWRNLVQPRCVDSERSWCLLHDQRRQRRSCERFANYARSNVPKCQNVKAVIVWGKFQWLTESEYRRVYMHILQCMLNFIIYISIYGNGHVFLGIVDRSYIVICEDFFH